MSSSFDRFALGFGVEGLLGEGSSGGSRAGAAVVPAAFDRAALDALPTAESLASDALTVNPRDPDWAPPAITNQWAGLVAGRGLFSYEGFSTPNLYSASEHGRMYAGINGGPLVDLSGEGRLTYRWYPSRIERSQAWRGLEFRATTLLPMAGGTAAVNLLTVGNGGAEAVDLDLMFLVSADTSAVWDTGWPPRDPVRAHVATDDDALLISDRESHVASAVVLSLPLVGVAGFDTQKGGDAKAFADVENPFAPTGHVVAASEPEDPRWRTALQQARLPGEAGVYSGGYVGAGADAGADSGMDAGAGSVAGAGAGSGADSGTDAVVDAVADSCDPHGSVSGGGLVGSRDSDNRDSRVNDLASDSKHVALHVRLTVPAGGSADLTWVHAIASDAAEATSVARRHLAAAGNLVVTTREAWEQEWRAAFDAESTRFSGYLPVLSTDQESVRRLYYMGVMTALYCRRTPTWGGPSITYVTGFPSSLGTFPHAWVFPWDTMMVSGVLSLLDPKAMRGMILAFLAADMHEGCAIDFRTGSPVGFWYAVNDYALIHMTWQYLRYTGDLALLGERVRGASVLDHLVDHARYYRRLAGDDGLADYGTAQNLLECVSSYTHKVASFNAANVWSGRTVAAMLRLAGREPEAAELEGTADALSAAVQQLYVEGEGYFACRQPNGSLVSVRHCLDFFTVLQCMPDALSESQVEEMITFFRRELKTTRWMHALSPLDPDSAFSSRTDHQDEGAYTTWPAYSLEVLLQTGHEQLAVEWMGLNGGPGLADVTRQGPFGQAYTHGDDGSPTVAGMPAKAPMEFPHIEKPVLLPGGKYAQVVIEALAGVQPRLGGEVEVAGRELGIELTLTNLNLRGRNLRLGDAVTAGD